MPADKPQREHDASRASPWLVGALALAGLLLLNLVIDDALTAVQIWVLAIIIVGALVARRRWTSSRPDQPSDERPSPTAPASPFHPPEKSGVSANQIAGADVSMAPQTQGPHNATPSVATPPAAAAAPTATQATAAVEGKANSYPMILTADEAAALLRIDQEIVIDGIRTGRLPGNEIGGHWRVRRKSLLTWVDGKHGRP